MPHDQQTYILASGEAITAAEIMEGFMRMALAESSFPLLSTGDRTKAVINMAFETLEWADEKEIG